MILLLLLPIIVSSQDSQYGQYQNGEYVQSNQYTMISGSTNGNQPQYNNPNVNYQPNGQYQQSTQNQNQFNQNQYGTNQQFQSTQSPNQFQSSTPPSLQYNQPAQQIPIGQDAQHDQYGRPLNQQTQNAQFDPSQQSSGPSEPIYDADGNVINGYSGPTQNNPNGQSQSSTRNPNQFNQNQDQFNNQNQAPNQFNQNQQYQSTQNGQMNQNSQQWVQNPNGVSTGNNAQLTQYSFNNGQCVYQNGQVVENGISRSLNQTEQQELTQFEQSLTQYGRALSSSMGSFVQTLLSWDPQSQSFPNLTSSSPQMPILPCFCSQSACQAGQVHNSQYSQQFIGPLQTGNSPQFDQYNNHYPNQQIQNQNQFQSNQYQNNPNQPQNNQYQNSQFQNSNAQYQNSQYANQQSQNQFNQNSQYQSNQYGRRR